MKIQYVYELFEVRDYILSRIPSRTQIDGPEQQWLEQLDETILKTLAPEEDE